MEVAGQRPGAPGRIRPSRPPAPSVKVVVVAHDPGPWFEEALSGLATQDYGRLSVLVVDAASAVPVEERVLAVLPEADVVRREDNPGFGPAANEALALEERPAFLAVCHDDVALRPDAIRLMVEEAIRSNAGIVGPKLVDWDDPRRLRQVGLFVDKTGAALPRNEPGELDQEQHDAVRDVFAVPGGCQLIRTDLLDALGGFDPTMDYVGEDVDLCWRAHVAGARVVVVPAAVGRHREALEERIDADADRLGRRHQVRTLLGAYGPLHLLRVVPQALLVHLVEALVALFSGRFARVRSIGSAWSRNLLRPGSLRRKRRSLHDLRQLRDGEVRRFQTGGFVPLTAFVQGHSGEGGLSGRSRALVQTVREIPQQRTVLVWLAIAVVLAFGSRHLLTRGVPAIGGLAQFPGGPSDLLDQWWSGWQPIGVGREAFGATGMLLVGVGSWVVAGAMGLWRTVLTVGLIPLGAVGAYRLLQPFGSTPARLLAAVSYLIVPVPYNALANGSWSGLVAYAAAPWILRRLAAATELAPFGARRGEPGPGARLPSLVRECLGLGLVLAAAGAIAPDIAVTTVLLIAGVIVGSLLAGSVIGMARMLVVVAGATAVAAVLHFAPLLDWLTSGPTLDPFLGARSTVATDASFGSLLRLDTGPVNNGVLGWALFVAAALSLVLANEMRLAWAIRAWVLMVGAPAVAWVASQGWSPVGLPRPEVLLVPGALGAAFAVALGMVAFEVDLPRYRFGWRQLVPVTAAVALVLACLPVLGASFSGRWEMPQEGFEGSLSFIDTEDPANQARVLWIGDADVLPLGSWELDDALAYAVSEQADTTILERWAQNPDDDTALAAEAVDLARAGDSSRLGRLLAPLGIRYVVVPQRLAPEPFGELIAPVPPDLLVTLSSQLDLERVELGRGVTVFENVAWIPERAAFPGTTVSDVTTDGLLGALELDGGLATAALEDVDGLTSASGAVEADTELFSSTPSSSNWELRVEGDPALRSEALGWANVFTVSRAGDAQLSFSTPGGHHLLSLAQAALWVLALIAAASLASSSIEAMTAWIRDHTAAEEAPESLSGWDQ